nr:uncharacterized protein LOC109120695 [Solanum lycopersicum]
MVVEWEGSRMVPLFKVPKKDGHAHLSAMQIVKDLNKGAPTLVSTIACSGEDHGATEFLPRIIETVLEENKDVMPEELPKTLPPRREVDHTIDLEAGAKPPAHAPYRMAPPELEELRKQLKELIEAGHIRPSKVKYFNQMDIRKGYYQVRIAEGDEQNAACVTTDGAYELLVMPFGITNAPATFCTLMNKILHPYLVQFISGYSTKSAPVTELLKKNKPWVWSEECQGEFDGLKSVVIEEPVLMLLDFTKTFEIHMDASDIAIGGGLIRRDTQ